MYFSFIVEIRHHPQTRHRRSDDQATTHHHVHPLVLLFHQGAEDALLGTDILWEKPIGRERFDPTLTPSRPDQEATQQPTIAGMTIFRSFITRFVICVCDCSAVGFQER